MELLLERIEPEVAKVTRATVGLGLWSAEEAAGRPEPRGIGSKRADISPGPLRSHPS
jgi:hypothetical protein